MKTKTESSATAAPIAALLLRAREAAELIGVSERKWWQMTSVGEAPRPVTLPGRATRWRRSDIEDWIAALH